MNIVLSGSRGFVGRELLPALAAEGHQVRRLVRADCSGTDIPWDPAYGPDPARLEGTHAVIHLAAEPIYSRWTEAKKQRIRDSRSTGTRLLAEALTRMTITPRVLISASAVGYYGDRGEETITEDSAPGRGFLAETCSQWENAVYPAEQKGIRIVRLRIGVVLSPKGGALGNLLFPFRAGLGGRLGTGRQFWSWVAMDDIVGIIIHALETDSLRGPINATAPEPVRNAEFASTLGRVLRRPTICTMPKFIVQLIFGEMGEAILLGGARVMSTRLNASGYAFRYRELEPALHHLLRR